MTHEASAAEQVLEAAHRLDVAGELVTTSGDRAGPDERGELAGRAVDPPAQGTGHIRGAPVLAGREHRSWDDDGVQVAEQRPERVLEHQGVPSGPGRCSAT